MTGSVTIPLKHDGLRHLALGTGRQIPLDDDLVAPVRRDIGHDAADDQRQQRDLCLQTEREEVGVQHRGVPALCGEAPDLADVSAKRIHDDGEDQDHAKHEDAELHNISPDDRRHASKDGVGRGHTSQDHMHGVRGRPVITDRMSAVA
jgi:hypothetical protein